MIVERNWEQVLFKLYGRLGEIKTFLTMCTMMTLLCDDASTPVLCECRMEGCLAQTVLCDCRPHTIAKGWGEEGLIG